MTKSALSTFFWTSQSGLVIRQSRILRHFDIEDHNAIIDVVDGLKDVEYRVSTNGNHSFIFNASSHDHTSYHLLYCEMDGKTAEINALIDYLVLLGYSVRNQHGRLTFHGGLVGRAMSLANAITNVHHGDACVIVEPYALEEGEVAEGSRDAQYMDESPHSDDDTDRTGFADSDDEVILVAPLLNGHTPSGGLVEIVSGSSARLASDFPKEIHSVKGQGLLKDGRRPSKWRRDREMVKKAKAQSTCLIMPCMVRAINPKEFEVDLEVCSNLTSDFAGIIDYYASNFLITRAHRFGDYASVYSTYTVTQVKLKFFPIQGAHLQAALKFNILLICPYVGRLIPTTNYHTFGGNGKNVHSYSMLEEANVNFLFGGAQEINVEGDLPVNSHVYKTEQGLRLFAAGLTPELCYGRQISYYRVLFRTN